MTATTKPRKADPLITKWFHSFTPCTECGQPRVAWQGRVMARVADGLYLVETFEWLLGDGGVEQIVALDQMQRDGWRFYADGEGMRFAYEHELVWRHRACDKRLEMKAP